MSKVSLRDILRDRIVIMDGGIGTLLQNLTGARPFQSCYDHFSVTCPEIVRSVHRQYLEAGADIITTNTFSANVISLSHYDLSDQVKVINRAAARLAREEADHFMAEHPHRSIFVAGSIGPIQSSISTESLRDAYKQQLEALVNNGVDILLFETIIDLSSLKTGIEEALRQTDLPIMLSASIIPDGHLYSGETLDDFLSAIRPYPILSIGLNCSCGGENIPVYIKKLATQSSCYISLYPNAGLPNKDGTYPMTPEQFRSQIQPLINQGIINIVGGCCGTTPEHIKSIRSLGSANNHK